MPALWLACESNELGDKAMNYSILGQQSHVRAEWRPIFDHVVAIFLLVLLLGTAACTATMRQVPFDADGSVAANVAVGDTVRILTKNGDRQSFKVTDITMRTLIGEDVEIAFSDIEIIEKRISGVNGKGATTAMLAIAAGALIVVGLSKVPPGIPAGY